MSRSGPVTADVVVLQPLTDEGARRHATTTVRIGADEPVFAGHYPGFPIFPGVCVVECVRLSATAIAPPAVGELDEVESTRFRGAVYPGDELVIELAWTRDGECWRCSASVYVEGQEAAAVRLRYRAGDTP